MGRSRRGWKLLGLLCCLFLSQTSVKAAENPLFGYTHMLPSPLTLPAGRFILGTQVGLGITHSLEIGTNLFADFYQVYNGQLKLNALDFPGLALAFYLGYQNFNLNVISSNNSSLNLSTWMPGAVLGFEAFPHFAVFLGGNLFYSNASVSGSGIETGGFVQGGQIQTDFSWAYRATDESLGGNALSAGVSYNSTFGIYGVGLSHHWKGFHVGFHYYPNASTYKIQPILSGGTTIEL